MKKLANLGKVLTKEQMKQLKGGMDEEVSGGGGGGGCSYAACKTNADCASGCSCQLSGCPDIKEKKCEIG